MTKNVIWWKESFGKPSRSKEESFKAPTKCGTGCLACRELLCNNIVVSCTTNVERRLELSEPWIDGITGWQSTPSPPRQGFFFSFPRFPPLWMEHLSDLIPGHCAIFTERETVEEKRRPVFCALNAWVAESHAAGKLEIRSNRANRRYNTAR